MRHPQFGQFLLAAGICGLTALGGGCRPVRGRIGLGQCPGTGRRRKHRRGRDAATGPTLGHAQKYCSKCHNAEDWAGGVAFDTMTPEEIPEQAEIWEHAVRKLRGRLMPPAGKPAARPATVHCFVGWMENTLDTAAATHPRIRAAWRCIA